jgi:hypothetical protein
MADLRFFEVSSEPTTLTIGGQLYSTPADAAQAGYEMIASKLMWRS